MQWRLYKESEGVKVLVNPSQSFSFWFASCMPVKPQTNASIATNTLSFSRLLKDLRDPC